MITIIEVIAKSNTILVGRKLSNVDRQGIYTIIRRRRSMFNWLNIYLSQSVLYSLCVGSRAGSVVMDEVGSVAGSAMEDIAKGGKRSTERQALSKGAKHYLSDTVRPNAQITVHYPELRQRYPIPVSSSKLSAPAAIGG